MWCEYQGKGECQNDGVECGRCSNQYYFLPFGELQKANGIIDKVKYHGK